MDDTNKVAQIVAETWDVRRSGRTSSSISPELWRFTVDTESNDRTGGPSDRILLYSYGHMINSIPTLMRKPILNGGFFSAPIEFTIGIARYPVNSEFFLDRLVSSNLGCIVYFLKESVFTMLGMLVQDLTTRNGAQTVDAAPRVQLFSTVNRDSSLRGRIYYEYPWNDTRPYKYECGCEYKLC